VSQRLEETGRTGQDGNFRRHFCHFPSRFFVQAGCLGRRGRLSVRCFCRCSSDDSGQQALAAKFSNSHISVDFRRYICLCVTEGLQRICRLLLNRERGSSQNPKGDVRVCRSDTAELSPTAAAVQQPQICGKDRSFGRNTGAGAVRWVCLRGDGFRVSAQAAATTADGSGAAVVRSRFESAGRRRVTLPPAMDCQQA